MGVKAIEDQFSLTGCVFLKRRSEFQWSIKIYWCYSDISPVWVWKFDTSSSYTFLSSFFLQNVRWGQTSFLRSSAKSWGCNFCMTIVCHPQSHCAEFRQSHHVHCPRIGHSVVRLALFLPRPHGVHGEYRQFFKTVQNRYFDTKTSNSFQHTTQLDFRPLITISPEAAIASVWANYVKR